MKSLLCSLFFSAYFSYFVLSENTVTTAKLIMDTYPRPSNFIKVSDWSNMMSSTPLDLFFVGDLIRRNAEDIWDWDFWCQLQPKTGTCSGKQDRFYYNTQLDTCQTFIYTGCGGNGNNFKSVVDCEQHCKGSARTSVKEFPTKNICGLQSNAGMCIDLINRYYYDINANACKSFAYGGCGGNQNNFISKEECMKTCQD